MMMLTRMMMLTFALVAFSLVAEDICIPSHSPARLK